jgi:hypothetical protein
VLENSAVNWLAVVIAAVANLVINTVWYLPAAFGKRWGALTGRDPGAMPNPMNYVVAVVGALITAYVLALFIKAAGGSGLTDGLIVGVIAWLGFQATLTAVGGMFEGRSWSLFYINAGAGLVVMAVMGAILGAMG